MQKLFNFSAATFLTLFLFLGFNQHANATHIVGADLSYECVSHPDSVGYFRIRAILYRDCGGIPLCENGCTSCQLPIAIAGADASCNGTPLGSVMCQLVSVRDVNNNAECPNTKSICTNAGCVAPGTWTTPAIERYQFEGVVRLTGLVPNNCCKVKFYYQMAARNGIVKNIRDAGATWFYSEAIVNRCLSNNPCNSSPRFANDPYGIVCAGLPFMYNSGAIDFDMDSLSFAFAPVLGENGVPVSYQVPYNWDKPFPWTGAADGEFPAGIKCDSKTGDIMFTAPLMSDDFWTGVMAIEVKQWKKINGISTVVGITRRDIQLYIIKCAPNTPPRFATNPSNANDIPQTNWTAFAGEQLCFDIIGKDVDFDPPTVSDTTRLKWNSELAQYGATFTPNFNPAHRDSLGPREASYKFCWTPAANLNTSSPFLFSVEAKDDRCPLLGKAMRGFSIQVIPRPDVTLQKQSHGCGKWQMKYNLGTSNPNQTFSSRKFRIAKQPNDFNFTNGSDTFNNVQQTPILQFRKAGKYLVELSLKLQDTAYSVSLYDTIVVDTMLLPVVQDTFVCKGSAVTISANALYKTPSEYRWFNNLKDTVTALNASPFKQSNLSVSPTQTRKYTIQIRDSLGCRYYDSMTVAVRGILTGVLPDSIRLCYGESYTLNAGNSNNQTTTYLWNTSDTTQSITRKDSGNYTVKMTDSLGCSISDTLKLRVNQMIAANAGTDTAICSGSSIALTASGGALYQWKNLATNTNITNKVSSAGVTVNPASTTNYEVSVYRTYANKECMVKDTVTVTVNPMPILTRPVPTQACVSADSVLLPAFGSSIPQGNGVWSYAQNASAIKNNTTAVVGNLKNIPTSPVTNSFDNWIKYTYTTNGGCSKVDSAIVRIYGLPVVSANAITWCSNGGTMQITSYSPNGDSSQEEWTGNGIYSIASGANKLHYFNPSAMSVLKLPNVNIQKYKYTHIYNASNPALRIGCSNEDTATYRVTPVPTIEAGASIKVCKNETTFDLSSRTGATQASAQSYWYPQNSTLSAALSDNGHKFNPSHASVPDPAQGSTDSYAFYFADASTGCMVRDTIVVQVASVPHAGSITGITNIRTDTTSFTYSVANHSSYNYLWTAQNGNIVSRTDSHAVSIMWLNNGIGRAQVQITNAHNCSDSTALNIDINTGLEQLQSIRSIALFPNPNNGEFSITMDAVQSTVLQLQLTDLLGKTLWQKQESISAGANKIDVQLNLPTGVYLIHLKNVEGTIVRKVFVE